jgi:hypothetical protein
MSGVQKFVRRGETPSREQLASLSRVKVPQTKLVPKTHHAFDTDSEAADTTATSFPQLADMHGHDDDFDGEDDEGVVDDVEASSFQEHGHLPNELLNMVEAPRRQGPSRWSNQNSNYAQHNYNFSQDKALPLKPQLVPGAQDHLNQFLKKAAPMRNVVETPRRKVVESDGDDDGHDDEPTVPVTRKTQKTRRPYPQTPAHPASSISASSHGSDVSDRQSFSKDRQLPIQTKNEFLNEQKVLTQQATHQHRSFDHLTTERVQKAPQPTVRTTYLEPIEDLEQINLKASQSQANLQEVPMKHPDMFDATDASAVMEDVDPYSPNAHARSKLEDVSYPTKKRVLELDYSHDALSKIKFSDLQSQPFDIDPNAPSSNADHHHNELDLRHKLAALSEHTDDSRRAFFATLSPEEWEDCGEWFVSQFGELVKKITEARRERRSVAERFENEVAKRYKIVEASGQALNMDLQEMKAGGIGVLKGRTAGV